MAKQGKISLLSDFTNKDLSIYPITLTDAIYDSEDRYTSLTSLLNKKLNTTELQDAINQSLKQAKDSGKFNGADGLSAYNIAVNNGYQGNESEWLASLIGPMGPQGPIGEIGPMGPQGPQGLKGDIGIANIEYSTTDIGIGTELTTGKLYLVYE